MSPIHPEHHESTMPKKVLVYLRDPRSTLTTACAESQLYYAKAFIKERGWKLVTTCRDEDIGEVVFTAQPGAHKLLLEVAYGSIDIVLCHTLDRLCSRLSIGVALMHDLRRKGIELWAADPGIEIRTQDLIDHCCNGPSKMLGGHRYDASMPDDLYEVEHLVPLPYGYRYTGAYNPDGDYVFGFKAVDKVFAEVVLRIFKMYAEGMSPTRIANALNAEGIPSPRGNKWYGTTIRGDRAHGTGILNDEIYIGRSWVPGRHFVSADTLQIVSDELWNRVKLRQHLTARRPAASP